MTPIEYLGAETTKSEQLEQAIAQAKSEIEHYIRHLVDKFGGFKLTVETAPMRAEDFDAGAPFEPGDAVRVTIRPTFRRKK